MPESDRQWLYGTGLAEEGYKGQQGHQVNAASTHLIDDRMDERLNLHGALEGSVSAGIADEDMGRPVTRLDSLPPHAELYTAQGFRLGDVTFEPLLVEIQRELPRIRRMHKGQRGDE